MTKTGLPSPGYILNSIVFTVRYVVLSIGHLRSRYAQSCEKALSTQSILCVFSSSAQY